MLEERFHVIVSFRTESTGRDYGDISARRLYEETRDRLIVDLGGEELRLKGLSPEDIGKWIKLARGIQLPLVPDLKRIRKNSGGLPLFLHEWIRNPRNTNYDQIKRDKLCDTIRRQETGLGDNDLVRLYKLSILHQPHNDKLLGKYLGMEIDLVRPLRKKLIEKGIFEGNSKWFQNQSRWVPQGLRNAGFNLLELPGSLNTWMGGIAGRELAFRGIVTSILAGTGLGSYKATTGIMDWLNDDQLESSTDATEAERYPNETNTSKK
jgi:hypothetical protein